MRLGLRTEIIDGDEYRSVICKDLGFSKADRNENIRRLGFLASRFSAHGIVTIISAINPYDDIRKELVEKYEHVSIVHIDCPVATLINRDTKGLYKRSQLPDNDPNKIKNLTGINDPFEIPTDADLILNSDSEIQEVSAEKLFLFILGEINKSVL